MPSFTHIWVHSAGVLSLAICVAPHIESVTTPVNDCCCATAANAPASASISPAASFAFVFISASPCDLSLRLFCAFGSSASGQPELDRLRELAVFVHYTEDGIGTAIDADSFSDDL